MADRWSDRLSEYLDGELDPAEREALQEHLFTCAACAGTLAELRRVVETARTLPDREPERDLWPGIASAIAAPPAARKPAGDGVIALGARHRHGARAGDRGPVARRRANLPVSWLAAAALALVVASAGSVWLLRRDASPAGPTFSEAPATAAPRDVRLAAEAASGLTGVQVDAAIADLEQRLEAGRGRLDPATVRVLEENLRMIDGAVEDARRALAADPGNAYVSGHLAATVRRKLELLRRANEIAAAQT